MPNDISSTRSGRKQTSNEQQVKDTHHDKISAEPEGADRSGRSDNVSLTGMAEHLRTLEQQISSQSEIDQDRVNRVREAISRGEYRINPEKVANKMMDLDSDL